MKKPKAKGEKLSATKVQNAVNAAIRRRDGACMVRDGRHECAGCLTASHFFSRGGNGALKYYPFNIFTQCLGHHGIHERNQENQDPAFYARWLERHYPEELAWMESARFVVIRYTQALLAEIYEAAKSDRLDDLAEIIYREIGNRPGDAREGA